MSILVNKLKNEHKLLVDTLNKITDVGITSREGQAKLYAAKTALLNHLALEDKELYPVLRKAAEKDAALKHTLDVFARDMEAISKTAIDFFGKYAQGGDSLEFAKDLGRLVAALRNRVGKEEDVLYAQYDKHL